MAGADDEENPAVDRHDRAHTEPAVQESGTPDGPDSAEPDVLLDVPSLSVDEIDLEVQDLRARVSLQAEVLDLLKLNVGADVTLGQVSLTITGVEAQALLKVRLDRVARIIERVLATVDRNPQLLEQLVRGVEPTLRGVGEAVGEVGRGAGGAVEEVAGEVGRGAGEAVGEAGRGARRAVEDVGRGAGETVEDVGRRTGPGVEDVGRRAVRAAEDVGAAAEELSGEPGEAAGRAADRARADRTRPRREEEAGAERAETARPRRRPDTRAERERRRPRREPPPPRRGRRGDRPS
ncbi:hypothetical protein HUO13_36610 [Saccharopolyspora erythraea]|uniref:hypothetical protein n=1 Tax=Saccharopolyspora erythraea TaxID=1836 RepID=UPI001BA98EB9|nr:hypothetical protein [Saccharopolyspora erythraea]QUH05570.1 hypothetical protein HUO13_36610 [Saccharopolyspora erythraea]